MTMTKSQKINDIATKILNVETLELRNRDSLDFYDISVSTLKKALEAAYEAGKNAK
jgi:hypothetical protein